MDYLKKAENNTEKLVSFVIVGRNDNYAGNFNKRITNTINSIATNALLTNSENEIEIVIVDWNSEGTTLADNILRVGSEAKNFSRVVVVPPAIVERTKKKEDEVFNTQLAYNVGVRRARGRFINTMPADMLCTASSFDILIKFLKKELLINREIDVDKCLIACNVDYEINERRWSKKDFLENFEKKMLHRRKDYNWLDAGGGGYAGFLMHRDIFFECRGWDEKLPYWGWADSEMFFRITQKYKWIESRNVGFCFIHQCHERIGEFKRRNKIEILSKEFCLNDDNWGLEQYELEEKCLHGSNSDYSKDSELNANYMNSNSYDFNEIKMLFKEDNYWLTIYKLLNACMKNVYLEKVVFLGYHTSKEMIIELLIKRCNDINILSVINKRKLDVEEVSKEIVSNEYKRLIEGFLGHSHVMLFDMLYTKQLNKSITDIFSTKELDVDLFIVNIDELECGNQDSISIIKSIMEKSNLTLLFADKNYVFMQNILEKSKNELKNYRMVKISKEYMFVVAERGRQKSLWDKVAEYDFTTLVKNIAIFGAGDSGLCLQKKLLEIGIFVNCFLDNDLKKKGTHINDILITSLDEIEFNDLFIIIASDWHKEITLQLEAKGLKYEKDFCIWSEK